MGTEEWDDPHGLLTEEFREAFADADSVSEALERAEQRPSSTDRAEMKRCPNCYATRLRPRRPSRPSTPDDVAAYVCQTCGADVDDPADPFPPCAFEWVDTDALADPTDRGFGTALDELEDEELTELAIRLYRPWTDEGPSYRELATIFPYSRKWIGDRVRAWKAGEHRDLVPDPTAEPEPITVDASSASAAVATDGGRRRWEHYGG